MKKFLYISCIILGISLSSCKTGLKVKQDAQELAGYTLKNKTELMQQKILHQHKKTVVVQP